MILEQGLKKEFVTCKHDGSHAFLSKNMQQCSEIKVVAKGFRKLTREGFTRQKIYEEKPYKSAIETART